MPPTVVAVKFTIAALHLVAPGASRMVELIALVSANLVATTVRFLLLRAWITPASGSGKGRIESSSDSRAELEASVTGR